MALAQSVRLPGFRFQVQAPAPADVLPRMDVAVFVGFAQAGPLHTPVAIESVGRFVDIFGGDAPLAWDKVAGEPVYAYLAPSVRAFFRNGGRRCYVVRVAGEASANRFPIPGLLCYQAGNLVPAFAQARAAGAWSDGVRVGASLLSEPVQVTDVVTSPLRVQLEITRLDIAPGDLLRLTFGVNEVVALLPVQAVEAVEADEAGLVSRRRHVWITPGPTLWLSPSLDTSPPRLVTRTWTFTPQPTELAVTAELSVQRGNEVVVRLTGDATGLTPGALLRLDTSAGAVWLAVRDVRQTTVVASPPLGVVEVTGTAWATLSGPPPVLPSPRSGERLTFELWRRGVDPASAASQGAARRDTGVSGQRGGENLRHLELGFARDHPRFWGALPTDEQLLGDQLSHAERVKRASLLADADDPRFPLAGGAGCEFSFPLGMEAVPTVFMAPLPSDRTREQRNGLASFQAEWFLDDRLTDVSLMDLMSRADFLRYQSASQQPVILRGIYAALGVEEATLIAVPDAVHRAWQLEAEERLAPPLPLSPPERPDWWHFLPCDPPPRLPRVSQPERGEFLACRVRELAQPTLELAHDADGGTFRLSWSASAEPAARFTLMEATRPDFSDMVAIYTGPATEFVIYGRGPGDYYYTVRVEADEEVSDWSAGRGIRVQPPSRYVIPSPPLDEPAARDSQALADMTLLTIHRALLRLCAARGDLLALLALPAAYRAEEALAYMAALKSFGREVLVQARHRASASPVEALVRPLSPGEASALSYGAVYHPWLYSVGEVEGGSRPEPPDGTACGLLARRAIRRGAWIAPANDPLTGVVALTPPFSRDDWATALAAQMNLVRQEARGFMTLSANTLSDDPDLRLIHVRRLLILLRRVALRLGATYVFEPNSPPFRRLVQQGFESLLNLLFTRGAFAGDRPETAYQVDVGTALNTAASVDLGRLIVELRVAPAQPLTFVTIRLVQTGDRGVVTEER